MAKKGFGELELAVLKVLWCRGEASVRNVQEGLACGCAYTTVMTVLQRLHEKGAVERRKEGRGFLYTAVQKQEGLLEKMKKRLFGGSSAELIRHLIDDISEEELSELEQEIQRRKR